MDYPFLFLIKRYLIKITKQKIGEFNDHHIPQPLLMRNVLPPDQVLIWKLKIPIADLTIDFILIKICVEMLVNYKIALVLQACNESHMLYYFLFSMSAGATHPLQEMPHRLQNLAFVK